ncbi:MAG: metalloregulator ArsR/SmtB family transcription factor [Pseudomonadota bacterium]
MTAPQPTFRALADPTRREILLLLRSRPMNLVEISAQFDMTRAAVKKHLIILRDGGLITMTPEGRTLVSRFNPAGLRAVFSWLEFFDAFWDDRLSALATAIEKDQDNA